MQTPNIITKEKGIQKAEKETNSLISFFNSLWIRYYKKWTIYFIIEHFLCLNGQYLSPQILNFRLLYFLLFFYQLDSRHWDHRGVTKELHLQFPSNKVTTWQELQFSETVTHTLIKRIKGHLSNARKECGSLPRLLFPPHK